MLFKMKKNLFVNTDTIMNKNTDKISLCNWGSVLPVVLQSGIILEAGGRYGDGPAWSDYFSGKAGVALQRSMGGAGPPPHDPFHCPLHFFRQTDS